MSPVTWSLVKRIVEVERDFGPYWQRTVYEFHPELTFFNLNGDKPLRFPKRSEQGKRERRALLIERLPNVAQVLDAHIPRVRDTQLLDAASGLWTARRIVAHAATRLPEDPEWDSFGLRMEMWR